MEAHPTHSESSRSQGLTGTPAQTLALHPCLAPSSRGSACLTGSSHFGSDIRLPTQLWCTRLHYSHTLGSCVHTQTVSHVHLLYYICKSDPRYFPYTRNLYAVKSKVPFCGIPKMCTTTYSVKALCCWVGKGAGRRHKYKARP